MGGALKNEFKRAHLYSLSKTVGILLEIHERFPEMSMKDLELNTIENLDIFGTVQVVEHNADFKIQIVENFEDLRIEIVNHLVDSSGKWKFVAHQPQFKIKFVEHYPDIKVKFVIRSDFYFKAGQ